MMRLRRFVILALTLSAPALVYGQALNGSGGGTSLPTQTGQSGKYLGTDGTSASWNSVTVGSSPNYTSTAAQDAFAFKSNLGAMYCLDPTCQDKWQADGGVPGNTSNTFGMVGTARVADSASNAAIVINALSPSGGTLSTADVFQVRNNGAIKYSIQADGSQTFGGNITTGAGQVASLGSLALQAGYKGGVLISADQEDPTKTGVTIRNSPALDDTSKLVSFTNGSTEHAFILPATGLYVVGTQPKAASNFTAFERSTGTVPTATDRSGMMHISLGTDSTGGAATHVAGLTETVVNSATMHVEGSVVINGALAQGTTSSYVGAGVILRESATGKFAFMDIVVNNSSSNVTTAFVSCAYYASPTSGTQAKFASFITTTGGTLYMKLVRSGSNILFQQSSDDINWTTLQTTASSTIFTTPNNIDQAGVGMEITATTDAVEADVISYNSG